MVNIKGTYITCCECKPQEASGGNIRDEGAYNELAITVVTAMQLYILRN